MKDKKSYVQTAKNQVSSLTLGELPFIGKELEYVSDVDNIPSETYKSIVLLSPSKESNLGEKLSKKIEKHIDEVVNEILNGLDVKHCYFFSSYESKRQKINVAESVKSDNDNFMYLYCPDAFLESLYVSIRNALAHGNIIRKNKHFYLFSLSSKEKADVYDRKITFLLKINKLEKIQAYMDAFKKFN